MSRKNAPRPKVGDVFTVPVDEERVGIGQVVAKYQSGEYFAIHGPAVSRQDLDIDRALASPIVLLALSFDAKIHAGDWQILGNRPVDPAVPLPAYQVMIGSPDAVFVEDYSGQRRRPIEGDEANVLPHREFVAPALLELAFQAIHGARPWEEMYEGLAPRPDATTAGLFGDVPAPIEE